jgi:hypothetical protein
MNFLDRISASPKISNFMKIRPVGAALFRAEERMDRQTGIITTSCNFAKAPNNWSPSHREQCLLCSQVKRLRRRRLDSPAYGSAQQVATVNHTAVKKETRIKTEYPSILFHKNRKITTGHIKSHTVCHYWIRKQAWVRQPQSLTSGN